MSGPFSGRTRAEKDVESKGGTVAGQRRDSGRTVTEQWRDSGRTVAGQWRDSGGTVTGQRQEWQDIDGTVAE